MITLLIMYGVVVVLVIIIIIINSPVTFPTHGPLASDNTDTSPMCQRCIPSRRWTPITQQVDKHWVRLLYCTRVPFTYSQSANKQEMQQLRFTCPRVCGAYVRDGDFITWWEVGVPSRWFCVFTVEEKKKNNMKQTTDLSLPSTLFSPPPPSPHADIQTVD